MAEQSKDTMDDIFGAPIGPAKGAKPMPTAPQAEKGVSGVGLTAGEERAGAAVVGAMLGPRVQRGLETAFPTKEARLQQAASKLDEERKLAQLMQNLKDEELLRLGVKPEDIPAMRSSGTKWMQNWAGVNREVSGGVPEASAMYNRMKGQGPISGRMTKMWGVDTQPQVPGQPKVPLVDRLMGQSAAAESSAATRAMAEEAAHKAALARVAEATPGPLARVGQFIKSPGVAGTLGGAGAGLSFYEAYRRFQEGDTSGAVIDALGGVGAVMSLFPGLQLPGMAIGLGAAGANMVRDYLGKEPTQPAAPLSQSTR